MVQPIHNTQYGRLSFVRVFYGMSQRTADGTVIARGGSLGILTNGTWVHFPSGHPIERKDDGVRILEEVNPQAVDEFETWWEHRDELEALNAEMPARPIRICPDDRLRFEDTDEEVLEVTAVYDYFPPKSASLEMALRLFTQGQQRREREHAEQLLSKSQQSQTQLDAAFGRTRAGRAQPVSAEEARQSEIDQQRKDNLRKAREQRQKNLEAKKRQQHEAAQQAAEED